MALTRAARIAEEDLYHAIRDSCSSGSTQDLDKYKSTVPQLMQSAAVNDTAVLESAQLALDAAYPPAASALTGGILNCGGVKNCKVCAA